MTILISLKYNLRLEPAALFCPSLHELFGYPDTFTWGLNSRSLLTTNMYMSRMHEGHAGGKTSSFKRCIFLKDVRARNIYHILYSAIETRPTPLCYLNLLHGGGAIRAIAAEATAFGHRDWDFACVITGVWLRDQHGTNTARKATEWVYDIARRLLDDQRGLHEDSFGEDSRTTELANCRGAYAADLGPDPRDAELASWASLRPNLPRLARIKAKMDPHNVLAYACPLPKPEEPRLIILFTGESCAGKDYCAECLKGVFDSEHIAAGVASISDVTKRDYAEATGIYLRRLLEDRVFKEQHREALTRFFEEQSKDFAPSVKVNDVLFITGMRDEAPMATFSHLVPDSKLIEVRIVASEGTRQARGGFESHAPLPKLDWPSDFTFTNEGGDSEAEEFAKRHLLPLCHPDFQRLRDMIRLVPNFPRAGIEFKHVLNIAQQPGGLKLVTSLLISSLPDCPTFESVACIEAGGFVFATALALKKDIPLVLIHNAGKIPFPTVSVAKPRCHKSESGVVVEDKIEMDQE